MEVTFWGVRGTIPCPSKRHVGYGGNTSCVEVTAGGHTIVLDAGTGVRTLGGSLMKRGVRKGALLFTHTHWDHIHGFPFFAPAYDKRCDFRILAGHLSDTAGGIRGVLGAQMAGPTFPIPLETMSARLECEDFRSGDHFQLARGLHVRTAALNHPNGATGYRIEFGGKSVCYVTDTEHVLNRPDQNVLGLIEGADLVIYDSTYTDEELPAHIGWGHSTWQEGIRLSRAAKVRRLAIFHHEPNHDDTFMGRVAKEAKAQWKGAFVAREGTTMHVGKD